MEIKDSFLKENFLWVVEGLEKSNAPVEWKQSLSTLAFMTTESYGKGVKEELLLPYLKIALNHANPQIKKIGIRFVISFKAFDLFTDIDASILAETFHEKYLRMNESEFLSPLKTTFNKLQKEGKLNKFVEQIAFGKFTKDIVKEICFQLWYRDIKKIEQALDIIKFLIDELDVNKDAFIPILNDFIQDLDARIYLKTQKEVKEHLKSKAEELIKL